MRNIKCGNYLLIMTEGTYSVIENRLQISRACTYKLQGLIFTSP